MTSRDRVAPGILISDAATHWQCQLKSLLSPGLCHPPGNGSPPTIEEVIFLPASLTSSCCPSFLDHFVEANA